MKRTDIKSILKDIILESAVEEIAGTPTEGTTDELGDFLTKWLIPVLEKGVGRDLIKAGFKDMIVKEINNRISPSEEIDESALSPGYLTNVYSPRGVLEATVYTNGGVSITLRSGERKIKMTAAIPLSELTEDYLKDLLIESGFKFSESLQKEITGLLSKLDSNEKVQSVKNIDNN